MHGIVARKLVIKRSEDGPEEIIEDVPRLRQILYDLQRPFLSPSNILIPRAEEGDLTLWWNRGLRHTAMEYPSEGYGDRLCHQVHVSSSLFRGSTELTLLPNPSQKISGSDNPAFPVMLDDSE